jgi:hypothetical protein
LRTGFNQSWSQLITIFGDSIALASCSCSSLHLAHHSHLQSLSVNPYEYGNHLFDGTFIKGSRTNSHFLHFFWDTGQLFVSHTLYFHRIIELG